MRPCIVKSVLRLSQAATVAALTWPVLLSGAVQAAPVAIVNHSFESPDAMGGYQNVLPDGWLAGGGLANQWVENNAGVGFTGGDGIQHAGLDTDGGFIYQDLGVAFAANTTYRINLASAHRAGFNHGTVEFGLFSSDAIGTDVGTAGFMDIQGVWSGSGNPSGDDQFNQLREASVLNSIGTGSLGKVYSFTTGAVPPTGNVAVFVRDASGGRVTFDNVRLDATPIPEPAGAVLVVVAIGSFLAAGNHRRRDK